MCCHLACYQSRTVTDTASIVSNWVRVFRGAAVVKKKALKIADELRPDSKLLVVDLEATCGDRGFPRAERETIEIGAVMVEANTLAILAEFQSLVRPVRHPELTTYCTDLTGITQSDVNSAPGFSVVFDAFTKTMLTGTDHVVFVSWGGYDRRQLVRDCDYHGVPYCLPPHVDLSVEFTKRAGLTRRASMARAVSSVGMTLEGQHHRGIDDARNLVRLLPWCLGREPIPA